MSTTGTMDRRQALATSATLIGGTLLGVSAGATAEALAQQTAAAPAPVAAADPSTVPGLPSGPLGPRFDERDLTMFDLFKTD